jgi:hypothetical protein
MLSWRHRLIERGADVMGSAWSRGLALSASRLGLAAFGAIAPVLLYGAIARFGWQGGYYGMTALVLGFGLPISWL